MGSFSRFAVRMLAPFLGLAALVAAPAHAEREPSANNAIWATVNAGGCSLILNMGALYLTPDAHHTETSPDWPATITWQGPCGANGLANGRGTMTVAVFFKEANFSTDYRSAYTGEMRDGVMSGTFKVQTTNNDGTGKYTSDYPAEDYTFTNGCDTEWDFDKECKFADAQAVQARFGAGGGSGSAAAYSGGTTYTTVGGAAVAPPSFAAPQESALGKVASGLVTVLGGRDGLFSGGGVTADKLIASLRSALVADRGAAIGGKAAVLDLVLDQVRTALGGANPGSTNGQIADLVMGTVRLALAGNGGGTPAPVQTAVAPPPPAVAPAPAQPAAVAANARSGASVAAGPKMVSAANIQSVIQYLASKGDTVTLGVDGAGKPQLNEAGNLYHIGFYDCSAANDQCQTLQFDACYNNFPRGNVTKTNEWTANYVKIKAYIDANGWVCLDEPVSTGIGGISYEAMDLSFDAFLWFRQNADAQFR